jgi:alpha-methylacyl-CoA racemase
MSALSGFAFAHPWVLFLLLVIPLLAWLKGKFGGTAGVTFSNTSMLAKIGNRRRSRAGAFLAALTYLALQLVVWQANIPMVGASGGIYGLLLAYGMVCALFSASRTGRGQVVDAAMVDGAASLMSMIYGVYARGQWSNVRGSNALAGAAHYYGCYECADGKYVAFGSIEPQFYAILREKLGLTDAVFGEQHAPERWPEFKSHIGAIIKTKTRDEWSAIFEGTDVCYGPVLDLAEAPLHPHNVARGTFIDVAGELQPAPSPRFSGTPAPAPRPKSPDCSDTEAVLLAAGLSAGDYAALKANGVVA